MSNFTSLKCGDTSYGHIYTALCIHFKVVLNVIMRVRFYDKLGAGVCIGSRFCDLTFILSPSSLTYCMKRCFVVMVYKLNQQDLLSVKKNFTDNCRHICIADIFHLAIVCTIDPVFLGSFTQRIITYNVYFSYFEKSLFFYFVKS